MNKEFRHLIFYVLGFGFNLVLVLMFWSMLPYPSRKILIYANKLGEYSLEFVLLNIIIAIQFIFIIKQTKIYLRN